MTYKIGTRVKKIAGRLNVGCTGVVCCGPAVNGRTLIDASEGCDAYLRHDAAWVSAVGGNYPAGTVSIIKCFQYAPITPDGHRAGEEGTCEPLDKLLSEVSREAV